MDRPERVTGRLSSRLRSRQRKTADHKWPTGERGARLEEAHNPISPIRSTGSLPLHLTASDSGLILGCPPVTVRSSRGEGRPAPGLWLRAQWRPSTRRSATLSPPWDGDTEPRSDPWLSERYGRIAWYVRTSRLTIVCRYPVRGRSCRRDGWLKPDSNPTGIDRCEEDAVPTDPPRLDRTVTSANVLEGPVDSFSERGI